MTPIRSYLKEHKITWADFAGKLGRSKATITKWGIVRPVPAEAVPELVSASDGWLKASDLRPDLWPCNHQIGGACGATVLRNPG